LAIHKLDMINVTVRAILIAFIIFIYAGHFSMCPHSL
jgi:hypothetical protein